jgi:hypothetical protein
MSVMKLGVADGSVVWVLPGDIKPSKATQEFFGPVVAERYRGSGGQGRCVTGSGLSFWSEFDVDPQDLLLEKFARSAFFPGRCDLADQLGEREIDTVSG